MSKYREEIEYWWFRKQKVVRVISCENMAAMGSRCFHAKGWRNGIKVFAKPMNVLEKQAHEVWARAFWLQYKTLNDLLGNEQKMNGDTELIESAFTKLFNPPTHEI